MGTSEIILIFVVYLLLFGAKGVPSLAQTLGKAVRQFREASSDIQREMMNTGREITQELNRVKDQVDPSPLTSHNSEEAKAPAATEDSSNQETKGEQASKS
jgi:sec-independent protein translocase protein TatA